MKSKHYPVVTVFVAALLTILPALILSLTLSRSSADRDIASADLNDGLLNDVPEIHGKLVQASPPVAPDLNLNESPPVSPKSPTAPVIEQTKTSSVELEPKQRSMAVPEIAVANPIMRDTATEVPQPVDVIEPDMAGIEQDEHNGFGDVPKIDATVADSGMIEMPTRPDTEVSYYEATGHLAMRTQPQIPDQSQSASKTTTPKVTEDVSETTSVRGAKSKKRKTNSDDDVSTETVADVIRDASRQPGEMKVRGNKGTPVDDEFIEDVAIQTPLESAPVGRVENVVAMTRAKGWPIALIKSDLPDDVWWVQQVVGIQGNSFGARVNFGNEYTISGSAFDMVIVFLDSADEVRRFRIAKQFKEVPKGVRHSREFHYIRN